MKLGSSHQLACLLLSLAAALTNELARAADFVWNVPNGDFNTDTNWNPVGLPGMFDRAIIDNGGTSTYASGIGTIDTLAVASATGTSGTYNMTGGDLFASLVKFGDAGMATASITSAILRAGGGSLFVGGAGDTTNGTGVMTVTGSSSLITSGDDIQFGRSGSGTLNFQGGRMTGGYTVVGKFGTGLWNHSGGVYDQDFGDIEIGDGGKPAQAGIPGPRAGTINLTGGVIQVSDNLAIGNRKGSGVVNISGGALAVTSPTDPANGNIYIGRGMDWETTPGVGGPTSLRVVGHNSIIIANNSLLMNTASVASSSTLIEEINSSTQTTIKVSGNANIGNGALKVVLNGYTPVSGNSWTIIQAGADLTADKAAVDALVAAGGYPALTHAAPPAIGNLIGTFASADFSMAPLTAGLSWNVDYTGNKVTLKVVGAAGVPGDYNGNGVVDAGDYVVWRKGGTLQNEVVTVGSVTPEDYTAWRARFGNTSGSGSGLGAAAAVPEPSSALLLAVFILWTVPAGKRRF